MFKKKPKIKAEFVFGIIAGTNVLSTKPVYVTWKRGKKKKKIQDKLKKLHQMLMVMLNLMVRLNSKLV